MGIGAENRASKKRERKKKKLVDKVEKEANSQYELVILEPYDQKVELQA